MWLSSGTDGRLLSLQHEELVSGVEEGRTLIVRDHVPVAADDVNVDSVLNALDSLSPPDLLDFELIADAFGLGGGSEGLDTAVTPRGYRLLTRVPRLPDFAIERLVDHFGDARRLLAAATNDRLQAVRWHRGHARSQHSRDSLLANGESNSISQSVLGTGADARVVFVKIVNGVALLTWSFFPMTS